MNSSPLRIGRPGVRSIFISDVHLGSRYANAETLLAFLQHHHPQYIYLVGDFIDGWQLKRTWHWQPTYNRIFKRLIELASHGSCIRYAPGNHDAFLRDFLQDFGLVEIADEFVHHAADQRRFLVTHGDQFDNIELRAQWLSVIGGFGYDVLMWCNQIVNRLRSLIRLDARCYTAVVKRRVKQAVKFISDFENRLTDRARDLNCHGVVCGHIHTPTVTRYGDIVYCNTGDWVENCSALLEYDDGQIELLCLTAQEQAWLRNRKVTPSTRNFTYPEQAVDLALQTCGRELAG